MNARTIDFRSTVPAYRQLAGIIREQIEAGELVTDQPVPSETTLVQRYGVARGTVRRAIEVLRDEGLVVTVQGRGTYVKLTRRFATREPRSEREPKWEPAGRTARLLALKLDRYASATPEKIWRHFLDATGTLHITGNDVTCAATTPS